MPNARCRSRFRAGKAPNERPRRRFSRSTAGRRSRSIVGRPPGRFARRPFAARNPARGPRRSAAPGRAVDAAPADEPRRPNRDGRELRAPNGDNRRLVADLLPAGLSEAEGIWPGQDAGRPRAETANRPAPAPILAPRVRRRRGREWRQGSSREMERATTPTAWAGRRSGGSLPACASLARKSKAPAPAATRRDRREATTGRR